MAMRWDPKQYAKYSGERARAFFDLVARIEPEHARRVIDVGCGSGELTALLAERWPDATVLGIDSSPEMIARARQWADGRVSFVEADAAEWQAPRDLDVLVTNAALQWVPDHLGLLRQWAARLKVGGWLGMQVPGNADQPSHALMRELAESPRWAPQLTGVLHHDVVHSPSTYAAALLDAGLVVDVWETTYLHVLSGPDPVLEWVRGTSLRPVLAVLDDTERAEFEGELAHRLRAAYPVTTHGTVLPFRRVFAVAHRPV